MCVDNEYYLSRKRLQGHREPFPEGRLKHLGMLAEAIGSSTGELEQGVLYKVQEGGVYAIPEKPKMPQQIIGKGEGIW